MRVLFFLLLSTVMAGAAGASSFVVVPAPKGGASVDVVAPPATASFEATASDSIPPEGIDPTVTLSYPFVEGEPPRNLAVVAPPAVLRQISPSVMAMEARPEDRIAAAKESHAHAPFSLPMVFRGGIAGDAFATPAVPEQSDQPQVASDAKPPVAARDAKVPSQPEPVAPPSPSPAGPTRAPE
jgi:hypothetical protein